MQRSDDIAALADALAKAQSAMRGAIKDATNPHFRSGYATLAAHIEAIKEALSTNGLSYSQFPVTGEGGVGVETILMHKSGQWIVGDPYYLPVDKQNAQGMGSALTYARRYSLACITGIAPEDDDDGNAAAAAPAKPKAEKAPTAGKMDEHLLTDWCIALKAQTTMDDLQHLFTKAILAAREVNDKAAEQAIRDAKDARKAALTQPATA